VSFSEVYDRIYQEVEKLLEEEKSKLKKKMNVEITKILVPEKYWEILVERSDFKDLVNGKEIEIISWKRIKKGPSIKWIPIKHKFKRSINIGGIPIEKTSSSKVSIEVNIFPPRKRPRKKPKIIIRDRNSRKEEIKYAIKEIQDF